ncbi:hypothetical protein [Enhygromyxa salina]|uniref:hypothetical protein n=1 Tax=Enhygromyxa salina TaxID=215803 RepID=UPI000D0382DD|nr:hypothetical protein [Enhygromyxa salina]
MGALTGQRNENSSLFSLEALAGLSMTPARAAPATEGSGLIDIRAMRAMLNPEAGDGATRGAGRDNNTLLPSFGEGGFGGLAADRLVTVAPAPSAQTQSRSSSARGPLYAVIGVLGLGVLGLAAALVLDQPSAPSSPEQVVVVAPAVEPVEPDEPVEAADDEAPADDEPPVDDPVAEPQPELAAKVSKPASKPANKPASKPANKPINKPTSKPDKPLDVDCLLNNKLPQCDTDQVSERPPPKPTAPEQDLANKLSQSDILAGVGPIKTAAKTCGSGTAVVIKFSVKGATGSVVSASPLEEHSASAVGKCVANAAKRATFPKFQAEQQGFTFTFRL